MYIFATVVFLLLKLVQKSHVLKLQRVLWLFSSSSWKWSRCELSRRRNVFDSLVDRNLKWGRPWTEELFKLSGSERIKPNAALRMQHFLNIGSQICLWLHFCSVVVSEIRYPWNALSIKSNRSVVNPNGWFLRCDSFETLIVPLVSNEVDLILNFLLIRIKIVIFL